MRCVRPLDQSEEKAYYFGIQVQYNVKGTIFSYSSDKDKYYLKVGCIVDNIDDFEVTEIVDTINIPIGGNKNSIYEVQSPVIKSQKYADFEGYVDSKAGIECKTVSHSLNVLE